MSGERAAAAIPSIKQISLCASTTPIFWAALPINPGWIFGARQITNCGANAACIEAQRINVSASFFLSIEFKETGYLIERSYKTAFGEANGTSTFQGTHTIQVPVVRFSEFLTDMGEIGNGVIVGQPGWEQTLENNKVDLL